MKSLDEVDAHVDAVAGQKRLAISVGSVPIIISAPGSYYLTSNVTGASGSNTIEIAADDVTLDLNGYSLIGVSGGKAAIAVPTSHKNIRIRGGMISGGVDAISTTPTASRNMILEDVTIEGISGGIWQATPAGIAYIIRRVHVRNCGAGADLQGVHGSVITDSTVQGANLTAAFSTVLAAERVERSSVTDTNGAGTVIGITGKSVRACLVSTLTGGGSVVQAAGITGNSVLDCAVSQISNAGTVSGISGSQIVRCSASGVFQLGGQGSGSCVGISSATSARECEALNVSGNTSSGTIGIAGLAVVNSFVLNVTNGGPGTATGLSIGTSAVNCTSTNCASGITVNLGKAAYITNCSLTGTGAAAGGTGILTSNGGPVRVDGNVMVSFAIGVSAQGSDLVIRNHVSNCTTPYTSGANAMVGPIVTGAGIIVSANPWANFQQ